MNPFELTTKLMSIHSVTGTEGEIGEFLLSHLAELGFRVDRQNVGPARFNVMAFSEEARVILCTHIDTVPPPLSPREDDEFIYGRGACDAKGILAAMLQAGEQLRRQGILNFGYLFVVGEETDSIGAKAANTLQWHSEYVVVGEPTQNKLARAQKGALMANLTVAGRAAHSGYPELGISAIDKMWQVLTDCENTDWGNDSVLGKGTFNVGVFQGGKRANIVPAHASASIMIRTVEPHSHVEEKMRRIIADRATMEVVSASDPQIMHVVDGFPTTVVSFGSDVPHLSSLGKRLLVGPGSILDAHTGNEKISKKELLAGVDVYEHLVRKLLE